MDDKSLWYINRVTPQEYKDLVSDRRIFFNEPDFTELNNDKADQVYYLIFMRENSARFGLIAGRVGNEMRTPFSAPYSYPVAIIGESKQETIDAALEIFEEYCIEEGIESIRFIFPPLFYDEHQLSGWVSAFYRKQYQFDNIDLNFALDLRKLNVDEETYGQLITQKGRKGLRRARRSGLEIIHCETEEEYREAYRIVEIGHDAKGFPTQLSFDQLMSTLSLVGHDAFIVRKSDVGIVSEFLYRINSRIVQGIYTGTHPDYMECNGMNLLTYYTIGYYAEQGFEILDKATAGKDSIPNYGLCNFKESVGCERSLKYTFRKELKKG
jgi:hypothetical protein